MPTGYCEMNVGRPAIARKAPSLPSGAREAMKLWLRGDQITSPTDSRKIHAAVEASLRCKAMATGLRAIIHRPSKMIVRSSMRSVVMNAEISGGQKTHIQELMLYIEAHGHCALNVRSTNLGSSVSMYFHCSETNNTAVVNAVALWNASSCNSSNASRSEDDTVDKACGSFTFSSGPAIFLVPLESPPYATRSPHMYQSGSLVGSLGFGTEMHLDWDGEVQRSQQTMPG
eukprot:CAMPEP_0180424696 /NCGR_PEP_ID=MMETSP1036_2-20121128/4871_2 /TAXON_ID=632150 /ORGANISM="Azadinium spinosum, Strain 3D9" /LENGTH=228 /DNA_ID=CAMNT_0022430143 /DNA_START=176 /DNA_END=863 /DNA_ORIENTATION=-